MTPRLKYVLCVALALISFTAGAQFYIGGNEPARLKWNSIETKAFQVVYPDGFDSLARAYIRELEKYRIPVGRSLCFTGGQYHKKPIPVILHTNNMQSNGEVTWAPKRMELQTLPQWSEASAMPWTTMLAIHEGRHYAQMQFGHRNVFKPLRWFFGEIIPGAAAIYPGKVLLEGDAVIAETALTKAGRGREPGFLMYYNIAYENGKKRTWPQWANGSFYRYTPDHYAFGYLVLSSMRTMYDEPYFMAKFFDYVSRRPYNPFPMTHAMRKASGRRYVQSYSDLFDYQYNIWAQDIDKRLKFMPYSNVSRPTEFLTEYSHPNTGPDGEQFWVKKDLFHNRFMIQIDSVTRREKRLFLVETLVDKMNHEEADSVIVWSELRKDPRWSEKVGTVIRTYNTYTHKLSTISHTGHYVYPIKVGEDFVAIDLCDQCCAEIVRFRGNDAHIISKLHVPSGIQPTEITHLQDTLYILGLSAQGYGIYRIEGNDFIPVFDPVPVQMSSLEHDGDCLTFESGHDGSWELFRYNPRTKVMTQLTSSRYGGGCYNLCSNGDVTWSKPYIDGSMAVRTKASDLLNVNVDPQDYHRYEVADKITEQEKAIAANNPVIPDSISVSEPKKWYKFPNGFNFHSWAPVYVDIDNITGISFDDIQNTASLGAMVMFQSPMNSFTGYAGYQARTDSKGVWHHSGHLSMKYSGLYPVFEAKLHFNERNSYDYLYNKTRDTLFYRNTSRTQVRAQLEAYVPLSWSDATALYGCIPRIGIHYRNDKLEGKYLTNFYAGVRGYVMSRTPSACVYPKWGIGAELMYFDPVAYAYFYGYLPSFLGQGLKLTYVYQKNVNPSNIIMPSYVKVVPRGINSEFAKAFIDGSKITADYAMPFPMGDWSIGDGFYCKRGIITPHVDCGIFKNGFLLSEGLTFELEFGAFCWVTLPITLGVTYSHNAGSMFDRYPDTFNRDHVGMVFNITLP